jgi:hypothetical protein
MRRLFAILRRQDLFEALTPDHDSRVLNVPHHNEVAGHGKITVFIAL